MNSGAALLLLAALSTACTAVAAPPKRATTASWQAGLARLGRLRAVSASDAPHTMRVTVSIREPFTGKTIRARGGVALSGDALRMILVGPGGTTALDLWTKGDAFRFSVPAIGLVRRGDASTPREEMRGMPVDFLRFWLLHATRGRLLWTERDASGDRFVLRDGAAVIDMRAQGDGHIDATRVTWSRDDRGKLHRLEEEHVDATGLGCGDSTYTQRSTGLVVEVHCEGEEHAPPNPRAFVDPDVEARP